MPGEWDMAGPEASPVRLAEQDAYRNFGQMAQANYTNVLANKQQAEIDNQKRLLAAFAQPGKTKPDGTPLTPAEQTFSDADKLRALGMPEQAARVTAEGALIAARDATAKAAQSKQHIDALKSGDDVMTAIGQFYDGVTDQAGFDKANAIVAAVTGVPSPLAGQQYSPGLVKQLKQAQLTARQRELLPYEVQKAQAQADSIRSLMDYRRARLSQYDAALRLRQEKADRDAKAGGDKGRDIGNPTETEVVQSGGLIRQAYPDLPREDLAHYSYLVASEARRIRKQNPGISAEEANQRALEENADSIQEIVTTEKVMGSEALGNAFGRTKTTPRYTPKPALRPAPAAAPAPAKDTVIPEVARKGMKFQEGKLYLLPNGKKGIRKGNGFEIQE
jgi:hypothetical protein